MEIKKFVKAVVVFTFIFELIGALVLTYIFVQHNSLGKSIYSATFHSISAFCTAGFSLNPDSFISYSNDITINLIIAIITIAGGIGFFVLYDLWKYFISIYKKNYSVKLSDHTKLVLAVSFLLMVIGTVILFFSEGTQNNFSSFMERILKSSFQVISASTTTGFNTVDIGSMQQLSLYTIVILMFIGASPGSTGGGIKTSAFGINFLFLKKIILNRENTIAFRRTISESTVNKALGITLLAVIYMLVIVFALSAFENFSLLQIFFEVVSALGTVGLSMGLTPMLSTSGKLLIIITMLVGRIGPLAIGYSLVGRIKYKKYTFPVGNVMAG